MLVTGMSAAPLPLPLSLAQADSAIHELIVSEDVIQRDKVRLFASENYDSTAVREETGSFLY